MFGLFNNLVFLHLMVSINWLLCFVCDLLLYLFTDVAQSLVVKHVCQHYWFTLVHTLGVCSIGAEMRSFVCFAYDSSSSLGGCVFLCKTHSPNTFESCVLRGQKWPCGWWVWNSPCSKCWLCNIAVSPVNSTVQPLCYASLNAYFLATVEAPSVNIHNSCAVCEILYTISFGWIFIGLFRIINPSGSTLV